MQYFPHDPFECFYRDMPEFEIKYYMKNLISALKHVHRHKLIHRDIKPSNFLYNREKRHGVLVDFGLTQVNMHFFLLLCVHGSYSY